MPRKGMRSLFLSSKASPSSYYPSTPARIQSEATMDRILTTAESVIMKWNSDTSAYAKVTSIFYENRREAREFIRCVNELQKSMHSLVVEDSSSEKLVRGQNLMEIAMKRLQKEFYQILSMNRAHLDPESVSARSSRASTRSSTSDYEDDDLAAEDEIRIAGELISEVEDASSTAMADLRAIAECMISSGYAKECLKIYKIIRKSIVDEGIYKLGVEKMNASQVQKMDWDALEMRINNWLNAVRIAVTTLFHGERILCDHVFAASDSIRESCFAEITREGAWILFSFPEHAAAKVGKKKKQKVSPEKVFRLLDMYTAISSHWPAIESIFSFESTSAVVSTAVASLIKLGESIRVLLAEFEAIIHKDSSKSSAPVPGGGVHALTARVADYVVLLADYGSVLADILAGQPLPPESFLNASDSEDFPAPAVSLRLAWLILVLLCKLDGKAKQYKEVSLSYLFLANNLQHVVNKVNASNAKYLLGEEWMTSHLAKVRQFAANYERLGWGHVYGSLPEDPTAEISPDEARERFRRFNLSFVEAHRKATGCVVGDEKLRDEIKVSIARKVVGNYREFYDANRGVWRGESDLVRYAPEDIGNYLSDLFFGGGGSGGGSSFSSNSNSSHSRPSRSR